jgi:ATP-dependent Clp protease ATP-binding subunit ClpA
VLLLDEIEKAHPDVFDTLLSVIDEGRLQLMNGKMVDFRNVVLLMTSNLGAKDAEFVQNKNQIGLGINASKGSIDKEANDAYMKAVRDSLKPEFIGRLDAIVTYNSLQPEVARMIAKKKVKEVSEFLNDKNQNLKLELSPEAMEDIFQLGYDPRYGARPMDRAIKDYIKQPLSKWIIEHGKKVSEPTVLYINRLKNGFDMEQRKPAAKPAAPAPR